MTTRARTPRFRPPPAVGTVGLYPLHAALAAAGLGLLAGPRAPGVVLVAAALGTAGGLLALRRRRGFAVAVAPPAGDPVAGVSSGARPASVAVAPVRVAATALACAIAVVAGAALADARLVALDRTALRPAADVAVRGFATDAPRIRVTGTTVVPVRLGASAGAAAGETVLVRAPARVRLPALRTGDEVAARGDLRGLRPREAFERRRGVHAVLDADEVRATGRRRDGAVDTARRRAEDALAAGLGAEQAALARGMVLGQDAALPDDLREAFRASGLAHLLAASGQNVTLLAGLVLVLLTAVGLPLRPRVACAIAAVALYVPLAGAGPSIQRAGVMGIAGLVAALAGRPASRAYALLLAAALTLAHNPRAAEDPGWQLSFAAVLAILALHRPIRGALVRHGAPGPVADLTAITLAATVGTAPLLSLHFGAVSLVSLPANLLAAPAVPAIMWLGTVGGALGEEVARLLNPLAALPLGYLAWLARACAALPHASVGLALPGPLAAATAYGALALAVLARRRIASALGAALLAVGLLRRRAPTVDEAAEGLVPRPAVRWAAVAPLGALACAVVVAMAPGTPRPPPGPTLSLLDVGQGDAVLVQDGPRAVLFDTGPPGAPLVVELRDAGVERLDAVVVTHSSADHEGGLAALLAALPVGLVLDGRGPGREAGGEGGGARFGGLPAGQARAVPAAGQVLRLGRLVVEVLWPPPGDPRTGDPNATATVALVRAGGATALLTADAESPVTLPLDLPRVDVLKVAHHGSEDPGLPALLARLRPRTALVPVGRNTYGHPAPSTLAALRSVPDVRRTDREGTIRVALAAPEGSQER